MLESQATTIWVCDLDLERTLDGGKDCRDISHGRVARLRQHPVQALGGLVNFLGQRLEANGSVYKIAQDQLGRFRFAIDEQGDGLVQKRLRKGRIVLHTRGHGFFEITGTVPCHFPFWVDALRRLYSSHSATAWSMSCC